MPGPLCTACICGRILTGQLSGVLGVWMLLKLVPRSGELGAFVCYDFALWFQSTERPAGLYSAQMYPVDMPLTRHTLFPFRQE